MKRRPRGTGCIFRPKGTRFLWIKYSHNGKTFRESAKTTEISKAKVMLRKRLSQLDSGTFTGPQVERILVSELAVDFLRDYRVNERKSYKDAERRWTKHLNPFLGGMRAAAVSTSTINRYIEHRQNQGAENATINRELAALKRMFNLAARSTPPKVHRVPAISCLKENNTRTGFVDDAEYEKLARFYPELWWRAYLAVGYNFGWRKGNMLGLRVRQVDLLNQSICLDPGTTKNDEGQTVKMTAEVYELLRECVRGKKPDDYVFTRKNGRAVKDFRGKWRKACLALGLARMEPHDNGRSKYVGLVIHDLRRSAVRNLERAGVSRSVAMKITGHKTESIYRRYAIVSESDLAEASRKIEHRREISHSLVTVGPDKAKSPAQAKHLTN